MRIAVSKALYVVTSFPAWRHASTARQSVAGWGAPSQSRQGRVAHGRQQGFELVPELAEGLGGGDLQRVAGKFDQLLDQLVDQLFGQLFFLCKHILL